MGRILPFLYRGRCGLLPGINSNQNLSSPDSGCTPVEQSAVRRRRARLTRRTGLRFGGSPICGSEYGHAHTAPSHEGEQPIMPPALSHDTETQRDEGKQRGKQGGFGETEDCAYIQSLSSVALSHAERIQFRQSACFRSSLIELSFLFPKHSSLEQFIPHAGNKCVMRKAFWLFSVVPAPENLLLFWKQLRRFPTEPSNTILKSPDECPWRGRNRSR